MSAPSGVASVHRPKAWLAILVGGLLAGSLDLGAAFIIYGAGVPRGIAGGLLGPAVLRGGGMGTYVLGIVLHFFIATSAAAVYYLASRKLAFLKEHPLICGPFYGIAVFLMMNLIVLPLSALHFRGPFQLAGLIQGLLVHMTIIGLPISLSTRQFGR